VKWATLLLTATLSATTQGQVVYKSVDAEGKTIYSDKPVPHGELVDTLEFDKTDHEALKTATEESAARIEQMAEVTDRLKKDRQERDAARLEEEALSQSHQQSSPPLIYREEYYRSHYPLYDRRYVKPDRRHDHRDGYRYQPNRDLNNRTLLVPKSKLLTPNGFEQKRRSLGDNNSRSYRDKSRSYRDDRR
jgi:hypothetical protein